MSRISNTVFRRLCPLTYEHTCRKNEVIITTVNLFFRNMIEEMPRIKSFKKVEGDCKYFRDSLRGT
jgi:hypothetical protein